MMNRWRGVLVAAGGGTWLLGVLVLELLAFDPSKDSLPKVFPLLTLPAGLCVMWGCWGAAASLDTKLSRVGLRSVSGSAATLGIGFGLDLLPNMFLGFLLAYTVGLFVLPVAFLLLGLGLRSSTLFPIWAKVVPFAAVSMAIVTYGFHALARNLWDPSDAVWYTTIGMAWALLGLALMALPDAQAADTTSRIPSPTA